MHDVLSAQDWPQWRGPARDGTIVGFSSPKTWPDQLTREWKVEVGTGHSSPVVGGQHVYLHSREGDQEVVQAIDLTRGGEVWRDSYPAAYTPHPAAGAHGKGPRSTPVLANGRLFTFGVSGVLSGYDARSGKRLWRINSAEAFDGIAPDFGASASPIVAGGFLVAHIGNKTRGAVVALDPETGKEQWRWSAEGPSYASPVLADFAGGPQLVILAHRLLVGLSPETGNVLWQVPYVGDRYPHAVTPTQHGSKVIISGAQLGTTAFSVERVGTLWRAVRAWHNPDISMSMSSPVVRGDLLYGLADRQLGQLFCIDARSGETRWTSPGRNGDTASVLKSAEHVLWFTSTGELVIVNAVDRAYSEVQRYQVADDAVWTIPAVIGRKILVRDAGTLALWSLP